MGMTTETDIARLLGEVIAVAKQTGDTESAQRLNEELDLVASQAARVVVVGEKKRGKSSLINALLRRPGLLPVDSDIATSVHITVFAAPAEQALVADEDHPGGFPVPLGAVAEYAALDPKTMEMRHPTVREVSIGLPDPLLNAGLELIDTPGVGGLIAGHAALTLAALSLADALLFVVNGSSELTRSECEFLKKATERVASVVFVLAQVDRYPKWQQVLAANQELVRQHAPRFADSPWYPVSSRNRLDALRAAADGNAERAERLDRRSEFAALEVELTQRLAGRAAELRAQNAAFVARRVLDKLIPGQELRRQQLAADPELTAELEAKSAALEASGRQDAAWRRELDRGFRELQEDSWVSCQRRLFDVKASSNALLAAVTTASASQIAHDFDAGLRAIWTDIESGTRAEALEVAANLAATLGAEGVDALTVEVPYPDQLASRQLVMTAGALPQGVGGRLVRLMPSLQGVSMVSMLGHLLFAAVPPLAIVAIGGAVATLLGRERGDQAARAQARTDVQRHVQDGVTQAQFEFKNALTLLVKSLRAELTALVEERMAKRRAELSAAKDEAARQLEESAEDRAPQLAACERIQERLSVLSKRVDQLAAIGA
jgi:GTPase SAR1 family protein